MPEIEVRFYRADDGSVLQVEWLATLQAKARNRCLDKLALLHQHGMTMARPESKTLAYLYDRFIAGDPEQVACYERARADSQVAGLIYDLRTEAGLSQRALAARVGTTASVICRLEDADYDGHSLSMLRRVAEALGRRVEISFPPVKGAKTTQPPSEVAGAGNGRRKAATKVSKKATKKP